MAVVAPIAMQAYAIGKVATSGAADANATAIECITGYRPGHPFNSHAFMGTWGPIGAGFLIHWVASKLGVNKVLGRAKVPILRI